MKHTWAALLLVLGCENAAATHPRLHKPAPRVRQHFVAEWFDTGQGRCHVETAEPRLTESSSLPFAEARIRPDVLAIDVALRCEGAEGRPLASAEALPSDMLVVLETVEGKRHAARPASGEEPRERWTFELPEGSAPQLMSVRRYDAQRGLPVVPREPALAKLVLARGHEETHVTLRPRFRDGAFDALLDQLAAKLAQAESLAPLAHPDAHAHSLESFSRLYRDVVERFRPARLELLSARLEEDGRVRCVLALRRPQRNAHGLEVARFELLLARDGESLRLWALLNDAEARSALTCQQLLPALEQSLSGLSAHPEQELCNVLGTLIPGRCGELDDKLVARALEVGLRCGGFSAEEQRSSRAQVPPDFQLTMRRGKTQRALDKSPRYVVSLFDKGQVVFHGRHWVSSRERSDGRTHRILLAGLYQHIVALQWFERRGGVFDYDGCIPSQDDGDVITVKAHGRERMALNRAGCRGPFSEAELLELRNLVERVAGVSAWTGPRPSYIDRGVQQWAVSE